MYIYTTSNINTFLFTENEKAQSFERKSWEFLCTHIRRACANLLYWNLSARFSAHSSSPWCVIRHQSRASQPVIGLERAADRVEQTIQVYWYSTVNAEQAAVCTYTPSFTVWRNRTQNPQASGSELASRPSLSRILFQKVFQSIDVSLGHLKSLVFGQLLIVP